MHSRIKYIMTHGYNISPRLAEIIESMNDNEWSYFLRTILKKLRPDDIVIDESAIGNELDMLKSKIKHPEISPDMFTPAGKATYKFIKVAKKYIARRLRSEDQGGNS